MRDLIDRQAAIDVLAEMQARCTNKAALIQNSKVWQQIKDLPSVQPEQCEFCKNRSLEDGDTLYISADWDGGIGFDYIRDIHYCPKCGRRL